MCGVWLLENNINASRCDFDKIWRLSGVEKLKEDECKCEFLNPLPTLNVPMWI